MNTQKTMEFDPNEMLVYILLIRRGSSETLTHAYVEDVFDSEEKAWNKIEDDFNRFSELVLELYYKVQKSTFLEHGLYFSYEKGEDSYGFIKYEILTFKVK